MELLFKLKVFSPFHIILALVVVSLVFERFDFSHQVINSNGDVDWVHRLPN